MPVRLDKVRLAFAASDCEPGTMICTIVLPFRTGEVTLPVPIKGEALQKLAIQFFEAGMVACGDGAIAGMIEEIDDEIEEEKQRQQKGD
jgi:hypothetical protein